MVNKLEIQILAEMRFFISFISVICYFLNQDPVIPSFCYYQDKDWMAINQVTVILVTILVHSERSTSPIFLKPLTTYMLIDIIASWVWGISCIDKENYYIPFIGEYFYVFFFIVYFNILFKFIILVHLLDYVEEEEEEEEEKENDEGIFISL